MIQSKVFIGYHADRKTLRKMKGEDYDGNKAEEALDSDSLHPKEAWRTREGSLSTLGCPSQAEGTEETAPSALL